MKSRDLIVAPATPAGRGAIGVVRLSGQGAGAIARALVGRDLQPRVATLCSFRGAEGVSLDRGLALFFPAGQSYTGEEMLELQGHGGPIVQGLLVRRCLELGARLAQPGEFTQRAFLNDRLDLAQAEAVADLIDAQSERAVKGAMRSLQGEFSSRIRACVAQLVELRALTESSLDFPEEGLDLVPDTLLLVRLEAVQASLRDISVAAKRGRRVREGVRLALVGKPNVGKSSLLNRLVQEDVAIVSELPGTTRDVLREHIVLEGISFEVLDTAGLRETADSLERLGIERTWRVVESADLVLWVCESGDTTPDPDWVKDTKAIRVVNKIDLHAEPARIVELPHIKEVHVSARTGEGMDLLRRQMVLAVGGAVGAEGDLLARERHLAAISTALEALESASKELGQRELFAEELRLAQQALNSVTGEFTSDDLLGEIFSKFCIGK